MPQMAFARKLLAFHMNNDLTNNEPRGWYSRGYLPHFDAGETRTQFITCRLYDSLPQNVLARIKEEIEIRKPENIQREMFILAKNIWTTAMGNVFSRNAKSLKS